MLLFLIWLLWQSNLFMCRLSVFLQTFWPTLSKTHTGRQGPSPWSLCHRICASWWSSEEMTYTPCATSTSDLTPVSEEIPPLLCHPPHSASGILQQASSSTVSDLPQAELCAPSSSRHHQATTAAQWSFKICPCRHVAAWDQHSSWEMVDFKMPGGLRWFIAAVTHQSLWRGNTWRRYILEVDLAGDLMWILERGRFLLCFHNSFILLDQFKAILSTWRCGILHLQRESETFVPGDHVMTNSIMEK